MTSVVNAGCPTTACSWRRFAPQLMLGIGRLERSADMEAMTFRCSWAASFVLYALTLAVCAVASWPRPGLAAAVGTPFVVFEAALLLRFRARVSDDGVLLYGRHWLPWSDVLAAKRYSLPIFPYLVVRRPRGLGWWIPLYVRGERDIADVLREKSPPNSPIRPALSAAP